MWMNVSKKGVKGVGKVPVEIYQTPKLNHSSLLIGWQTHDTGKLSSKVIHFLNEKMDGQKSAEIKPINFFSFGGIRFKHDFVQVPESLFWACEKKNLILFRSDEPEFEYYPFLNTVLELAESRFQAKEVYTLNGTLSFIPHTRPRRIFTVFNQAELKERFQGFDLEELTWEGPPALSSFLLWIAKQRGIPGMSLWVEIPFYLAAREDPQAIKITLSFLNRRFNLGLDLSEFDSKIQEQNEKIAHLREEDPEINEYIARLEKGLMLDEEEQLELTKEVDDLLKEKD
jgi:predicted ATP-grasp superfamily ATP-dependent carboligase